MSATTNLPAVDELLRMADKFDALRKWSTDTAAMCPEGSPGAELYPRDAEIYRRVVRQLRNRAGRLRNGTAR
jgi:hypothetical protein